MISCDFAVLGAGQAGIVTALKLATSGLDIVLIEENEIGGSWLYSLEFPFWCWQKAVNQGDKSFDTDKTKLLTQVSDWNQKIQKKLDQKQQEILEKLRKHPKVKIIYGKASFVSKSLIEVNSATEHEIISFKQAIICSGKNQINLPELAGIGEVDFLYQHSVFVIDQVPESLAIIGCTLFNLEVANLYASLGCHVKIIETKNVQQVLRFFDSTCLNFTFRQLLKKKVSFVFEAKIVKLAKHNDQVKLWDDQKRTYVADKVFIFAKETFEGNKIALEKTGIKADKNGIAVNQNGQTIQRNIWAIGACVHGQKNLHWTTSVLAEKFKGEVKSNSIVLFGSNNQMFGSENKPLNFEVHRLELDCPVATLGLSFREAESRYGSSIQFEILSDFFASGFVKLTFNQVNGQILGIGLTGQLAQTFYTASLQALTKKMAYREFKNFLLNSGLEVDGR